MDPLLELRDPHRVPSDGSDLELGDLLGKRAGGPRIRCPRCGWRPRASDRWQCECFHVWNTFDTRGRCPGCDKQWQITVCLACLALSPHADWYEERPE